MKKVFLLLALVASTVLSSAATITMADPTIYFEDGYFYLTGTNRTGSGFDMYRSSDLVHWNTCGNATNGLAMWKEDTYGTMNFWAPQIFKHNEKYYIAYAAEEQIGIAEANSPMGPFKQQKIHNIKNTTKQIDPFLFRDDDGTVYMYYVRLDGSNSLYVAKMKDDLSDIAEDPTFCLRPSDNTWEHTTNYTNYKVSEGPTVIKDGAYYYLLYSCNDFHDIDYSVGYAYSKSPKGPWTKVSKPFLTRHNTGMNGSGHGDLFQDGNGQWYYVFHVHASNTSVGTRRTAIVPITLTDNVKNKFVPDPSRIILCDNNASATSKFPEAGTQFEVDGIHYRPNGTGTVMVTFGDPVNFGDYAGDVSIPTRVEHDGKTYRVTAIGSGAFHNCARLSSVEIPTSITQISDYAFEGSTLRDIIIPSACTKIGVRAFALCDKLKDVVMKATTPPVLSDDAFTATAYSKCKLWVPTGKGTTYSKAAGWKNFAHISGVAETSNLQYDMKVGTSYYTRLDDTRCAISPESNFYYTYREPNTVVGDTITCEGVPYAVTQVGKSAFRECHYIESVVLSAPVDTIQTYGFYNSYRLRFASLPSSLRYIGSSAFAGCTALDSIVCYATEPPFVMAKTSFNNTAYNGVLVVPEGSKSAYEADEVWKNFARIEEMTTTSIGTISKSHSQRTDGVYSLDGRRISSSLIPLRRGTYIVNGKKVIL